jgi:hypothetical protein
MSAVNVRQARNTSMYVIEVSKSRFAQRIRCPKYGEGLEAVQTRMTTNAISRQSRLLATDSRWSLLEKRTGKLYFVDDTGFDKMADRRMGSIICAGDAQLIQQWREWFLTPVLNRHMQPPVERTGPRGQNHSINISVIYKPDAKVAFSFGWYLDFEDEAKFSGTGASYAKESYSLRRCCKTSVENAAKRDPMTGGEVKYVDMLNDRNNLSRQRMTVANVHEQLNSRGYVMDMNTGKVTHASSDPALSTVAQGLKAGLLNLSAPTAHPELEWTDTEKANLARALEGLADLEDGLEKTSKQALTV